MKIAIVGLGVAGANAARTIAAGRPGVQIDIYGAEPHLYYVRPKLPSFLAGEVEPDALYFYAAGWYQEHGITVHTGARAEKIDPAAHRLLLAGGASVGYDRLLITAGARPFIPPIPGADLPGVFSLWTIEDATHIRAYAGQCRRAVVIGGGLLGLEAARGLRTLGLDVTVLEAGPWLMRRQLDAEGAAIFRQIIEGMGIGVRVAVDTERIEGASGPEAVRLKNGERLPADLVLIAAGAHANIEIAQAAGLETKRGIVVNSHLQTSAADIYAAGDVVEHNGIVYGIIPAAIEQAQAAANNLAEIANQEYMGTMPTNTLKIVGVDLTSIGETAPTGDRYVELRRTDTGGQYIKLVLKEGKLQGAILLGHRDKVHLVSQAVARRLDAGGLRDELLQDVLAGKH